MFSLWVKREGPLFENSFPCEDAIILSSTPKDPQILIFKAFQKCTEEASHEAEQAHCKQGSLLHLYYGRHSPHHHYMRSPGQPLPKKRQFEKIPD